MSINQKDFFDNTEKKYLFFFPNNMKSLFIYDIDNYL